MYVAQRRRVKNRFYIFLAAIVALIAAAILLIYFLSGRNSVVLIEKGVVSDSKAAAAVVLRDEQVVHMENYGKIDYYAAEGETVQQDGLVATVYRQGYSTTQVTELDTVRQQIYDSQMQLLGDIVDKDLSDIEGQIKEIVGRISALKAGDGDNLVLLQRELNELLDRRTVRLREIVQADDRLNGLYAREAELEQKIDEWVVEARSSALGIVSYYLDGYERQLSPQEIAGLDAEKAQKLLQPAEQSELIDGRLYTDVYRLVNPERCFLAIGGSKQTFAANFDYSVMLPDTADRVFIGRLLLDVGEGKDRVVVLELENAVPALLTARQVNATIGVTYEGLKVPVSALRKKDGVWSVQLADEKKAAAVPVNIVFEDGEYAIIREKGSEGLLAEGVRILSR